MISDHEAKRMIYGIKYSNELDETTVMLCDLALEGLAAREMLEKMRIVGEQLISSPVKPTSSVGVGRLLMGFIKDLELATDAAHYRVWAEQRDKEAIL